MRAVTVIAAMSVWALGCSTGTEPMPSVMDTGVGFDAGTGARDAGFDAAQPDANIRDSMVRDSPPVDAPYDAGDGECARVRVETRRAMPNVIVIIDRSGSMTMRFDAAGTRWEVLRDALISMPDGLVFALQSSVRFGMAFYSEDIEVFGCPDLSETPAALDNYVGISTLYGWNSPGGNTPTGQAVQSVTARIDALAPERSEPTVLVLATDGEPATCEDGTDIMSGRALTVTAVTSAFGMGIRTYVISVGLEIASTHLQEVANAGIGHMVGEPDAPFWVATDTSGLRDALSTIVGGVLSCTLELEGMIDPSLACMGTLTLGTEELECGTDWRAIDATHIEVLGAACDRLQLSTETLFGTFPCIVLI